MDNFNFKHDQLDSQPHRGLGDSVLALANADKVMQTAVAAVVGSLEGRLQ